ncbi:hypothetical protein GCM10027294_53080 [Marinactinospora endophytica]
MDVTVSAAQARDRLGELCAMVASTRSRVCLTVDGVPDGALVPPVVAARLGMPVGGRHGIRQARQSWAAVRRAARDAPQGITHRGRLTAVLICQSYAEALSQGAEVLETPALYLDESGTLRDHSGVPLHPGRYALTAGTLLSIAPVASSGKDPALAVWFDPDDRFDDLSDEVIFDIMSGAADRLTGAYMGFYHRADSPEAKQRALQQVDEVWDARRDADPDDREGLIALIHRFESRLAELRQS